MAITLDVLPDFETLSLKEALCLNFVLRLTILAYFVFIWHILLYTWRNQRVINQITTKQTCWRHVQSGHPSNKNRKSKKNNNNKKRLLIIFHAWALEGAKTPTIQTWITNESTQTITLVPRRKRLLIPQNVIMINKNPSMCPRRQGLYFYQVINQYHTMMIIAELKPV